MVARMPKPARRGAAPAAYPRDCRSPKDDPQGTIRAALRRQRRALGLTQEQAALLIGLSRLAYHRIETGQRRIRAAELAAICAAYNCPLGELVENSALGQAFVRAAAELFGAAETDREADGSPPQRRV